MRFTIKIFFFLYFLISSTNSFAEVTIETFTNYLSNLKAVSMDFNQIDSRGQKADGKLIIQKPHRFRINYYPPYPLLLLGNKREVIMYDYSLQQTTRVDAKENLFNFLLVDMKDWEKNFKIENIFESDGDVIVKLYNHATDRTISMVLQAKPLELKHIIVDEPDGNVIKVSINNIYNISSSDPDLFLLPNPDIFGKPARFDQKAIEKKYR